MQRILVMGFLAIGLIVAVPTVSRAQVRGSDGGDTARNERIFGFMDRNRDGRLDAEEVQRLPSSMRTWMEDNRVNLSRGLSKDDFIRIAPKMMESLRGGSRSSDRGSRSGRESGDPRDRSRRDDPRRRNEPVKKQRIRVTVDLPDSFTEGDKDSDGQIALHEWKAWKSRAAIAEFIAMDRNGDGFLTPKELVEATGGSVAALIGANTGSATSGKVGSSRSPSLAASTASPEDTKKYTTEANRYFGFMDRNRDGAITSEEWARSRTIRPLFEKAGVDLAKSMSKEQFATYYVSVKTSSSDEQPSSARRGPGGGRTPSGGDDRGGRSFGGQGDRGGRGFGGRGGGESGRGFGGRGGGEGGRGFGGRGGGESGRGFGGRGGR